MSTSVRDAIVAGQAELTRVVDPPTGDLAYGIDLSCVTDVTEALDEVDPNSPTGIAEAAIRRLTTPRGGLIDDPDYGINLTGYLNKGTTTEELRTLVGDIRNELRKDDRIDDVDATIEYIAATNSMRVKVVFTPADPDLDTFTLTFTVDNTEALIESIA